MNIKQLASILILLISCNRVYSQTKKVKKRIEFVTNYFNNNEYSDTTITTYNIDGSIIEGYQENKIIVTYLDSMINISEVEYIRHDRKFLSNDLKIDVYTYNYKDSIIQFELSGIDTTSIYKEYYCKGKLFKRLYLYFTDGDFDYSQEIKYSKYTKRREIAEVIEKGCIDCVSDTIKIDFSRKREMYKTYN